MDVTYTAPAIGGAGQSAMVATVTMPITGRPRRVEAVGDRLRRVQHPAEGELLLEQAVQLGAREVQRGQVV